MQKCPRCGYRIQSPAHKELQRSFPKAFTPWLPADDGALLKMTQEGWNILSIAEELQRQPTAVLKRIEKLGLTPPLKVEAGVSAPAPEVPERVDPL